MSEAIDVLRVLWTQAPANYAGKYYSLRNAYCEPRPRIVPKIMIGGDGGRYVLPLVAEKADIWFSYQRPVNVLAEKVNELRAHCERHHRSWDSIRKATPLTVFLDKRGAMAKRRALGTIERDQPYFAGDPVELREHLSQLIELGFYTVILTFADFPRLADMHLFLEDVRPFL